MDINTLAKSIVEQATGDRPAKAAHNPKRMEAGKARAKAIGPDRAAEIATNAAERRWERDEKRASKEKAEG